MRAAAASARPSRRTTAPPLPLAAATAAAALVVASALLLRPALSFGPPPPPLVARRRWAAAVEPLPSSASSAAASAEAAGGAPRPADDGDGDVGDAPSGTVIVAGATGYIGRAVVRESVRRGYDTVALVRDRSAVLDTDDGRSRYAEAFDGARVVEADVEDAEGLADLMAELASGGRRRNVEAVGLADLMAELASSSPGGGGGGGGGRRRNVEAVISCLASPRGTRREAEAIDYRATLNCLDACRDVRVGARHFVLLSAFCVRRPLLELQRQKLRFEAELTSQADVTYSIVRPTAFFKSISGQLEGIQSGAPYVLFGDGAATRCNPIAEEDLADFMLGCLDPSTGRTNRIMNVGGPDAPLTNRMLGEMMYRSVGATPKFVYAPTWIFDYVIDGFQWIADWTGSERWADAAETARIGKYYAVEDMLTTDPEEKYGSITVQDHYDAIANRGQDPFTPVRATAVIARVLESLPAAASVSVPVGYALLHPEAVGAAVAPLFARASEAASPPGVLGGIDFSVVLAALHSN